MWLTVITQQLGAETLSSMEGGDRTEDSSLPGLLVGKKGPAIGLCPGRLFPSSAFEAQQLQAPENTWDLTSDDL